MPVINHLHVIGICVQNVLLVAMNYNAIVELIQAKNVLLVLNAVIKYFFFYTICLGKKFMRSDHLSKHIRTHNNQRHSTLNHSDRNCLFYF